MVELKDGDSVNTVGVFFVLKKNGTLRVITDTRMVNMYFIDPHHTDLPTACGWSQLRLDEEFCMYTGAGDISNAFITCRCQKDYGVTSCCLSSMQVTSRRQCVVASPAE